MKIHVLFFILLASSCIQENSRNQSSKKQEIQPGPRTEKNIQVKKSTILKLNKAEIFDSFSIQISNMIISTIYNKNKKQHYIAIINNDLSKILRIKSNLKKIKGLQKLDIEHFIVWDDEHFEIRKSDSGKILIKKNYEGKLLSTNKIGNFYYIKTNQQIKNYFQINTYTISKTGSFIYQNKTINDLEIKRIFYKDMFFTIKKTNLDLNFDDKKYSIDIPELIVENFDHSFYDQFNILMTNQGSFLIFFRENDSSSDQSVQHIFKLKNREEMINFFVQKEYGQNQYFEVISSLLLRPGKSIDYERIVESEQYIYIPYFNNIVALDKVNGKHIIHSHERLSANIKILTHKQIALIQENIVSFFTPDFSKTYGSISKNLILETHITDKDHFFMSFLDSNETTSAQYIRNFNSTLIKRKFKLKIKQKSLLSPNNKQVIIVGRQGIQWDLGAISYSFNFNETSVLNAYLNSRKNLNVIIPNAIIQLSVNDIHHSDQYSVKKIKYANQ